MPIDTILKLADLIVKCFPYLKTFTGQRRRDYFEKAIEPLFNAFEEIQDFYNALFIDTKDKCVNLINENTPFLAKEPELSLEALQKLANIKDEFLKLRTKDEGLRDSLRQDAQEIFKGIKWSEEKRFLTSVIYYFLGNRGISPTDEIIDREIEGVIEKGGKTIWDSPSTQLYKKIKESRDLNFIIEKLDESRIELNQSYMNVRKHYIRVKNAVLMET